MPRINWSKNGSGFYVLLGDTWYFLGKCSNQESAQKLAYLIGLPKDTEIREFTEKPSDMTMTRAKMPRPQLFCYKAVTTQIEDQDWEDRTVYKCVNMLAPNEEVALIALEQILDEPLAGRRVEIHEGITRRHVKVLATGYMPFIDNRHVYFCMRDMDMRWIDVNKAVHR